MSWRKSRAGKISLVAFEAAGAIVAALAALAGFTLWRAAQGPVTVGLVGAAAEFAIERALPPHHDVHVRKAILSRDKAGAAYTIRLENVVVTGPARARVAELTAVELAFAPEDLLRGRIGPRAITIVDPFLKVIRDADRRLSLDYGETAVGRRPKSTFRLLTGDRWRGAFQQATLKGAKIEFDDVGSGRSWEATGADAEIRRDGAGYVARIDGAFDIDGKKAALHLAATYAEKSQQIVANLDVTDAPVGDMLDMFYGDKAVILTAPVSGKASITLTASGQVVSSAVEGRAENGELLVRGTRRPVGFVELSAKFDPKSNRFDVANFAFESDGARGRFEGVVGLKFNPGARTPHVISLDAVGSDIIVAERSLFAAPFPIERAAFSGAYDVDTRTVEVSQFKANLFGATLSGDGRYAPSQGTKDAKGAPARATIIAHAHIDGAVDRADILRAWPLTPKSSTRDFIAERMTSGKAANADFVLELPGTPATGGAPEKVSLTFDIADAGVIYAEGMTPLTRASGRGALTNDRLLFTVSHGVVGPVALTDGAVDFTSLDFGAPVHYRFVAEGGARDIMTVLNQEPLVLLKGSDLEPKQFSGNGRLKVDIMRPNKFHVAEREYEINGAATFKNLGIISLFAGADVAGAAGTVTLKSNVMNIKASGALAGAPVTFDWTTPIIANGVASHFSATGVVDSATADVFGVPTRQMIRGPVRVSLAAEGEPSAVKALHVDADFSDAALIFSAFGWTKPASVAAKGALDLVVSPEGVDVTALSLTGGGADIAGRAHFDAQGLADATLPKFALEGAADLDLTAVRRGHGALNWTVGGRYLNAAPLIADLVGGQARKPDEKKSSLGVDGRVDRVGARGGAAYRDVALHLRQSAGIVDELSFDAVSESGAPLSVRTIEGTRGRRFSAKAGDVGALLAGLFDIGSVRQGVGELTIDMGELTAAAPRLKGFFSADNARVVDAPLLARIFSAGSLTGLSDLLNGEGIEISKASGEFEFYKGRLTVADAVASGPSVGLTAQGVMTVGGGPVDLKGAVAPVYQINSLLGRAPVIGSLLIGRKGEGVVALSYDVKGQSDAPVVTVDPLSALAPGILRRLFETPTTGAAGENAAPPPAPPRR